MTHVLQHNLKASKIEINNELNLYGNVFESSSLSSPSIGHMISYHTNGKWTSSENIYRNISLFGVVGDGITDDTANIQTAFDVGGSFHFELGKTYLCDDVDITTKVNIDLNGAIIKRKTQPTAGNRSIFLFSAGSENSTLFNGTFDGNKSSFTYSSGDWTGVRTNTTNLRIERLLFQNFITNGMYVDNGNGCLYNNINIVDCGAGFKAVRHTKSIFNSIMCENIDNNGAAIFQHAFDCSEITNCILSDLHILNMGGDASGLSTFASGFTLIDVDNCNINNISVIDMVSTVLFTLPISFVGVTSSVISGVLVKGFVQQGIEFAGAWGTTMDNFLVDSEYTINTVSSSSSGIIIHNGGFYPLDGSGGGRTRRTQSGSRNLHISNGTVMRCSIGVRLRTGQVTVKSTQFIGNTIDGIRINHESIGNTITFPGSTDFDSSYIDINDCIFKYNGRAGLVISTGSNLSINNCTCSNNGQVTSYSDSQRSGITCVPTETISNLSIIGCKCEDTQTNTLTDAASFEPHTSSATFNGNTLEVVVVTLVNIEKFNVGQYINLKNAASSVDVIGTIAEIENDEATVFVTGSVSLTDTGNLTSLTGTLSTSGEDITGVGTLFLTEITGPYWLKADGEYRQVVKVLTNTTATLESAFTVDLSSDSAELVSIDITCIPSQQYGIDISNASVENTYINAISGESNLIQQMLFNGSELLPGSTVRTDTNMFYY